MERPLGIVLIAIMQVVSGVIGIFGGLVMTAIPRPGVQVLGLGLLILSALGFASAYGLWNFQSWGRVLVLVLEIVGIPLSFVMPAAMGTTLGPIDLLFIGISVIVIVYLLQPSIADRFSVGTPSSGARAANDVDANASYDVKKWNALTEFDPEIAAALGQLEPYGSPAVAELATKFLALNDKQYLGAIVKQITEKYRAQREAQLEGQKWDEIGRNVRLVWRTPGVSSRECATTPCWSCGPAASRSFPRFKSSTSDIVTSQRGGMR